MSQFEHLYFDLDDPVEDTVRALQQHGGLVFRKAVPTADLPAYYEAAIRKFDEKTEYPPERIVRHRGWMNGSWLAELAVSDGQGVARLVSDPRLARHLSAALRGPAALHPLHSVRFRDPAEPGTALPFHQHPHEADPGELSSEVPRLINIVVPFTPFDGTCSDLEMIMLPLTELFPPTTSPETQFAAFEVDKDMVLSRFGARRWRPRLELGDIIVFRDGTLHRSYVDETMSRKRASVDLRVFEPSHPLRVFKGAPGIMLPTLEHVTAPA